MEKPAVFAAVKKGLSYEEIIYVITTSNTFNIFIFRGLFFLSYGI